jgi:hypothetical protein
MPRKAVGLTAKGVQAAAPGRYGDGGGLYVLVRPGGARFWLFRYVINKRMREMGLGAASGRDAVTLANARIAARKLWEAVRANRHPLEDRNADAQAKQAAALAAQARNKTFRDVASLYIAAHRTGMAQRQAPGAVGLHARGVCASGNGFPSGGGRGDRTRHGRARADGGVAISPTCCRPRRRYSRWSTTPLCRGGRSVASSRPYG